MVNFSKELSDIIRAKSTEEANQKLLEKQQKEKQAQYEQTEKIRLRGIEITNHKNAQKKLWEEELPNINFGTNLLEKSKIPELLRDFNSQLWNNQGDVFFTPTPPEKMRRTFSYEIFSDASLLYNIKESPEYLLLPTINLQRISNRFGYNREVEIWEHYMGEGDGFSIKHIPVEEHSKDLIQISVLSSKSLLYISSHDPDHGGLKEKGYVVDFVKQIDFSNLSPEDIMQKVKDILLEIALCRRNNSKIPKERPGEYYYKSFTYYPEMGTSIKNYDYSQDPLLVQKRTKENISKNVNFISGIISSIFFR